MTAVSESSLGCYGTFDGEHPESEGPSKNSQERSAALALLTSTVAGCVAMSGATFVYHAPGALEVSFEEEFSLSGVQFGRRQWISLTELSEPLLNGTRKLPLGEPKPPSFGSCTGCVDPSQAALSADVMYHPPSCPPDHTTANGENTNHGAGAGADGAAAPAAGAADATGATGTADTTADIGGTDCCWYR
jgi:hypothetical protein